MITRSCSLLLVATLAAPAAAQFPGDIFFANPSVSVAQGTAIDMEIQAFSGSTALGAAAFEVEYDPAEIAIDEVRAGTDVEFETAQTAIALPGKTVIVNLNDTSTDTPFGTVSLATLVVRPLVAVGQSAQLDITVKAVLDGTSAPFQSSQGFSATVLVTSSGNPPPPEFLSSGPIYGQSWAQAGVYGQPRRLGYVLKAVRGVWFHGFYIPVPVEIHTFDPSAPRDR